jgi:hypothetical protein
VINGCIFGAKVIILAHIIALGLAKASMKLLMGRQNFMSRRLFLVLKIRLFAKKTNLLYTMSGEIRNKMAQSTILTMDLESLYTQGERIAYDIAKHLFQGLIIREKDLREFVKTHDWAQYAGKHVALFCSQEAIIPTWAYMLLAAHFQEFAQTVWFGSLEDLEIALYQKQLQTHDWEQYRDQKVVVKGCSDKNVPTAIYVETMCRLAPIAKLLMFGEACSAVPLYKRRS